MTFTQEELEQKRREDEYSDQRQFLKGCYSKIQDGLRKLDERSAERAIWELVQNARDQCEHARIMITLGKDAISIEHHGRPFDFDSLSSLVKQVSSQDKETGDKVGQYGTGFMTTHKFSKRVFITGDFEVTIGNKTLYADLLDYLDKPHPEEFCLDRSSADVETFTREMAREINNIKELRKYANREEQKGVTIFRYPISEEKKARYYNQIRQTLKLLPYVVAFNDHIEEIGYVDEEESTRMVFRRCEELREQCVLNARGEMKIVCVINREINGTLDTIRIHMLENEDRTNRIVIPPMPAYHDDVTLIPSLFIHFPLLKTENWGINFIYNSSNLWPTEPRDGYQLPENNEDVTARAEHNKAVIEEMDRMLFDYFNASEEAQNSIGLDLAKVCFKPKESADSLTREYLDSLQNRWTEQIVDWAVIPTADGKKCITDENVAVLSPELFEGLTEEEISTYLPVMQAFAEKVNNIPSENVIEWTKRVCDWAADSDEYYITIDQISEKINRKEDELHSFLILLKTLKKQEQMEKHAIIPNRKGKLHTANSLHSGKQITDALYKLAEPILGSRADKLVDPAFDDVYSFAEYTRENLRDEINSIITEWRKTYLGMQITLKDDTTDSPDDSRLIALINYCNAFRSAGSNSLRSRLIPLLSELYGIPIEQTIIPRHEKEEESLDLYRTAYNYLWEDTLLWISMRDKQWLDDAAHIDILLRILTLYKEMTKEVRDEAFTKYAVFPNRNKEMCLLKDLKTCKLDDDDLYKLYKDVTGTDLNELWVMPDFADMADFDAHTGKQIGEDIDQVLAEGDYKSKHVLTIIRQLDKGKWGDYFVTINLRKHELQYNQCSAAVRESIYRIQMMDDEEGSLLSKMAELAESEDAEKLLELAEKLLEQQREEERQLRFKYAIGKAIEDALREKMREGLDYKVSDVQNGQDIIISKNGVPVFYVEVKSKWNFSSPAFMSHNQILQAVKEKEHYALMCVDCRPNDSSLQFGGGCGIHHDATEEEIAASISDILQHTWVHTDIGNKLAPMLSGIIEGHRADDATNVKVDGEFWGSIPLKVFVEGQHFDHFISELNTCLAQMN